MANRSGMGNRNQQNLFVVASPDEVDKIRRAETSSQAGAIAGAKAAAVAAVASAIPTAMGNDPTSAPEVGPEELPADPITFLIVFVFFLLLGLICFVWLRFFRPRRANGSDIQEVELA